MPQQAKQSILYSISDDKNSALYFEGLFYIHMHMVGELERF